MSDYISSRVKQLRQEREVAKKQSSSASSKSQKSESYVAKRVSEIRAGRENPVKGAGTLAQESEDRVSAANKTSPGGLLPSLLNMLQRSTELQNQTTYRNREIMNEADAGLGQAFANLITPDDPVKALTKAEQSTGLRTVPTAQREQIVQSTLNRDGATDQEIEEAKSRTPEALYNEYNTWLEQGDNRDILSSLINAEQAARRVPSDQVDQYIMDTLLDQGYTVDRVREVQNRRSEYEKSVPFGYDITHRIVSSIEGIGSDAVGSALMALPVFSQALDDILFTGQKTSPEDIDDLAGQMYQLGKSIYGSGQENLQESRLGLNDLQELAYGAFENVGELIALALISPGIALGEQTVRAAGAGIADMADAGRSSGAAALSALGHGAISYGIEKLGIGQMMRNMGMRTGMAPAVDAALDRIASLPGLNRLPAALAGTVANAGEEATEEFVQSYADTALDTLLGAPNTPGLLSSDLLNEALQSAAGGAAGGALIGGISSAIGQARTSQRFQPRADEVANNQLTAAIEQAGQAGQMQRAAAMEAVQNAPAAVSDVETAPQINEASSEDTVQQKAVDSMLDKLTAQSGGRLDASAWGMLASQPQQTAQQESHQTARERYQEQRRAERIAARQAWDETQHQEARLMAENTTMSEAAVNTAVEAMPADVSGEVYALASNSMYQLARQGLTESADEALDLAARSGVRVNQVLAAPGGAEALQQVFNQGLMEGLEDSGYGQAGLADAGRAGTVEYADGTLIPEEDRALMDLFAASSDTAVTVRQKLENDAGGYVDTALGQVFFGAEAGADTFGTILHESNHWYNAWDEAGGRKLQTELLKYQAQQMGFESVDELAQQYIQEYQQAGEPLTYAQACEEITSDALRGVFDTEESFKRWVNHQQNLAQQNAGQRGTLQKVMDAARELLDKIISKAKSILSRSPDNAAAKHAQSLAESQKRALEELYYKHAETAMEAERRARAANENAESVNRNAEFENENVESANEISNSDNDIENSAEDTESKPVQQTAERMKEDVQRYQLPVDQAQMESGQRAAAWENVDRAGMEQTLEEAFSLAETERVPVENIRRMTKRILKEEQSRADESVVVKQLHNLIRYMTSGKADFKMAFENAIGIADVILQRSGKKDSSFWNKYEDLHYFKFKIEENGVEHQKLVQDYGTYELAKRELARFGITVTTSEKSEAQSINQDYKELSEKYPELFSSDITDSIDQLYKIASVRQAIKPSTQNVYGEDYEEAKADLALRIIGGLVQEGVADKGVAGMLRQRINQNLNIHRTAIQKRVLKVLNAQERRARNEAFEQSQRIVRASGEANLKRAKAWAETSNKMREAMARSQDAVQRARDARTKDATRRSIGANVAKLNRMLNHPSEENHIPESLLQDALTVAQIGNALTYNDEALLKLYEMENRLKKQVKNAENGNDPDGLASDLAGSGILDMLENLTDSMSARRRPSAKLEAQADAAARGTERGMQQMYELQGAQEEWKSSTVLSKNVSKSGTPRLYRLTLDEMITIRDLTSAVLTTARNYNKLLSIKKAQRASEFSAAARSEVQTSYEKLGEKPGFLKKAALAYHENVLNAERFFGMLGGYLHDGAMETLARALSAGEARQIAIREEGARIFSDVLDGKENREKLRKFAGPNAELVEVGLSGGVKVNRAQAVTIWMHLQNNQNAEHVLRGGVKIPNMQEYAKGDMKEAYRKSTIEHFELDDDADLIMQKQAVQEQIEKVLTDYDWMWIRDLQKLLNEYTKEKINGTSRMLSGYDRAVVENYFPLVVDPDTLQKQIEGVVYNGTIEGRGFLKERKQHAAQPVLLEECSQVMVRSLSDVSAYAGLAPAIRDFNKVWNANRNEGGSLKATVRSDFGDGAVRFVEEYISDLQQQPRGRKSMLDALNGIRGRYAGAVMGLNPKVALGQMSGVFSAGSELGTKGTAAAANYMAKRMTRQLGRGEDAAIRQEMMDWGYWGLEGTLTDGPTAELAELKSRKDTISRITEKLPGANALETMDKLTREGIWVGAKTYVNENLDSYGLTSEDLSTQSPEYRAAVVKLASDTINRTQPNYTVSQLAAIQRNPNQLAKILTMFKTQGFQNYGVMQYAVGDYRAQSKRLEEAQQNAQQKGLSAEKRQQAEQAVKAAKQQVNLAGQRLKMAAGAQAAQALVYAVITGVVSALAYHKLDDLRDEEGRITLASAASKILMDGLQSATVDNVFVLPEAMAVVGNLFGFRDDDPVSVTGIDAFGDLAGDLYKIHQLVASGGMDFPTAVDKFTDLAGSAFNLAGLPASQFKRLTEGVAGWAQDIYKAISTEGVSLGDVINMPTSSSQYDQLYTSIFEEPDPGDVAAAMEQLRRMDELNPPSKESNAKAGDSKVLSELLKREKEYGGMVQEAAQARLEGNESHQRAVRQKLVNTLADALGINKNTKEGQRRLSTVIDKVDKAITDLVKASLGADSNTGATVYANLFNEMDAGGDVRSVQNALRKAGFGDDAIKDAVRDQYKQAYLEADDTTRRNIETKLTRLTGADGEPYFTGEDLQGWVMDYELKGFNDSVYTDLDEALQTQNLVTAQEEINRYMEAGKSASSIRTQITNAYKQEYLKADDGRRREIAQFIMGLHGTKGERFITADTLYNWILDDAKARAAKGK